MKAITKPILGVVIEIRVLKHTRAIYFFKVGIPDLGTTKMKCQYNVSWAVRLIIISYFWWATYKIVFAHF
jgi:hypothetical protein